MPSNRPAPTPAAAPPADALPEQHRLPEELLAARVVLDVVDTRHNCQITYSGIPAHSRAHGKNPVGGRDAEFQLECASARGYSRTCRYLRDIRLLPLS